MNLILAKTTRLADPYVVAGDRAYLIGQQDGQFPRIGAHIPGEMGGLWAHPHKLLDGFWCAISPAAIGAAPTDTVDLPVGEWLPPASRFESLPWGVRQWFDLPAHGLRLCRTMVVPDARPALLVDLLVQDLGGQARDVDMTVLCRSSLRPGWLDPRPDGADQATAVDGGATVVTSDATGPWWVAWGSLLRPLHTGTGDPGGPGEAGAHSAAAVQCYRLAIPAGGEALLRFGVHGSTAGADDAVDALHDLLKQSSAMVRAKQDRLDAALAQSRLDVPDPDLVRAWTWTRCAYDWLVRDVPSVGRGLGAGLPEYPWWFSCDTAYALRGLLPLGGFALADQSLRLLAAASQRHNPGTGRIIHELSCTGRVFNPGNTQETPQFACAVLETYLWSGDRALIADLYPLCRDGVLAWTLGARDRDGDLLPDGYGITEAEHLDDELIDSAVWTHEGLRAVGRMASIVGDTEMSARCAHLAPRLGATIERRFWLADEDLYADWIATPRQAQPCLEVMRARAVARHEQTPTPALAETIVYLDRLLDRAAALPDEETAWPLYHWVINAPLEVGLTARAQAARALARLEGARFTGPEGVYLSGLERGHAMSISTGALAAAECAYGRVDQALRLSRLLAGQLELRMPGAISEMSPDGGCFVQAWSGYGVVYPLACGVFGLYPDAEAHRVVLCPRLPGDWTYARLQHIRVGQAHLDVELTRRAGTDGATCRLRIDEPGWQAVVVPADMSTMSTLPALTPLAVHAAPRGERWGCAPELLSAGTALPLRPGRYRAVSV